MRCEDPGHDYRLDVYDGPANMEWALTFMKREGAGYPGNVGSYQGTNCQEVIRALIDRVKYLDRQIEAPENEIVLASLRSALWALEVRAARRHKVQLLPTRYEIEAMPTCRVCGHVVCRGHGDAE